MSTREPPPRGPVTLTTARARILCLFANGETQKSTAHQLGIKPETVAYHVAEMKKILGARNSAALVALAIAAGVLTTGQWPVDLTGILTIDFDSFG